MLIKVTIDNETNEIISQEVLKYREVIIDGDEGVSYVVDKNTGEVVNIEKSSQFLSSDRSPANIMKSQFEAKKIMVIITNNGPEIHEVFSEKLLLIESKGERFFENMEDAKSYAESFN